MCHCLCEQLCSVTSWVILRAVPGFLPSPPLSAIGLFCLKLLFLIHCFWFKLSLHKYKVYFHFAQAKSQITSSMSAYLCMLWQNSCFPVQGTLPEILWLSMWCDALSSPKLLKYPHQRVPFVFTTRWKQILTFNKRKGFLFSKEQFFKNEVISHFCLMFFMWKVLGIKKCFVRTFLTHFSLKLSIYSQSLPKEAFLFVKVSLNLVSHFSLDSLLTRNYLLYLFILLQFCLIMLHSGKTQHQKYSQNDILMNGSHFLQYYYYY